MLALIHGNYNRKRLGAIRIRHDRTLSQDSGRLANRFIVGVGMPSWVGMRPVCSIAERRELDNIQFSEGARGADTIRFQLFQVRRVGLQGHQP